MLFLINTKLNGIGAKFVTAVKPDIIPHRKYNTN